MWRCWASLPHLCWNRHPKLASTLSGCLGVAGPYEGQRNSGRITRALGHGGCRRCWACRRAGPGAGGRGSRATAPPTTSASRTWCCACWSMSPPPASALWALCSMASSAARPTRPPTRARQAAVPPPRRRPLIPAPPLAPPAPSPALEAPVAPPVTTGPTATATDIVGAQGPPSLTVR